MYRSILLGCIVVLFSTARLVSAQPAKATSVMEADKGCQPCHQQMFDKYLNTYMAKASGSAGDLLHVGQLHHLSSEIEYSVDSEHDGPHLHYHANRASFGLDAKVAGSEKLDYFLGSGHLGTTYLYSKNGYLFESPIAYYNKIQGYAMKPGFEASSHIPSGLFLNDGCLRCHMSAVRKPDPGTENHFSSLAFLHTGITCESCHGDTAQHVSSGGKSPVVNPVKLSPIKRDSTCIVCHLEGDVSVERAGKSVLNYRPGEDIRDYVAYFSYASETNTRRAVSEIEQFTISRCKLVSGDRMSCMSCHDVHSPPSDTERATFYRAKCLSCHTGEQFAVQHHPEDHDCTHCHMPKTGATNVAHVAWTDHRIRRVPEPSYQFNAQPKPGTELIPLLEKGSDTRDLGLAYYELVVQRDTSRKAIATSLLSGLTNSSSQPDIPALRALGVLAEMNGRKPDAERLYREVLKSDPNDLTANTNLGTLLAQRGDLLGAELQWKDLFNRNEDQVLLGRNLAVVQCLLGEGDIAKKTLETALIYSPDDPGALRTLQSILNGEQKCSVAASK